MQCVKLEVLSTVAEKPTASVLREAVGSSKTLVNISSMTWYINAEEHLKRPPS